MSPGDRAYIVPWGIRYREAKCAIRHDFPVHIQADGRATVPVIRNQDGSFGVVLPKDFRDDTGLTADEWFLAAAVMLRLPDEAVAGAIYDPTAATLPSLQLPL
jgi:hypothetical protein